MNLPNRLTVARLFLAGLFVVLVSVANLLCYIIAYAVFTVATLTDYYDGKIARDRNLITDFGKLLDPVVDKVFISASFIMLMRVPELWIPAWCVVAIVAREFLVTGARSWAAAEGVVIPANVVGKVKTVIQMVFVYVFLFGAIVEKVVAKVWPEIAAYSGRVLRLSSFAGIALVAAFTVFSGVQFVCVHWSRLDRRKTT